MVRTPRGMMPMCVAEKIFGPGLQGMGGTKYNAPNGMRPSRPTRPQFRSNRPNLRMNSFAMGYSQNPTPFGAGIRPVRLPAHNGMVEKQQIPQQPSQSEPPKKAWPPGLTDYIQRSFSRCKND